MGEAKRRRQGAHWPSNEEFEAAHLFDLYIVYGPELPALWAAGKRGDRKAAARHDGALHMIAQVYRFGATPKPALCLLCGCKFTLAAPPPACVAVVSRYDDPKGVICSALCDDCEQDPDLMPRVVAEYRKAGIISNARIVPPPSPQGHA